MVNSMKSKILKSAVSLFLAVIMAFCPIMMNSAAALSTGDVNGDGKISSVDALIVLQSSTELISLSADAKSVADVNWDGSINSTDALDILQVSTGLKASFPEKPADPPVTPPEKPEDTFKPYQGKVTAKPSLNLRKEPTTNSDVLASIPYQTVITVTAEKNGWGKTTYSGQTGWVSLTYVTKTTTGKSGTFTITCYGFGHGVGMSQCGAIEYAERGWTYDQILLHYYHTDNTKILKDTNMPATVKFGGQTIDLRTYIGGSTYAETGDYVAYESIKSLMVAIYSFAKFYNFNVSAGAHVYESDTSKWKGTAVECALNEVLGQYVAYNGKAIEAIYCSSVGGKTTSSENAWGYGPSPAYLKGGVVSPESEDITKRVYTYTPEQIKSLAASYLGVTLTGDPSTWFTDIVHDKSIDANTGYISSMKVGGKTIKGVNIYTGLFRYQIRSHCFNIKYNP